MPRHTLVLPGRPVRRWFILWLLVAVVASPLVAAAPPALAQDAVTLYLCDAGDEPVLADECTIPEELSRTVDPAGDAVVEFAYPLAGDIAGTEYHIALWLASGDSTTFEATLLVRSGQDGAETELVGTSFTASGTEYVRQTADMSGPDPDTARGDQLILRLAATGGVAGGVAYAGLVEENSLVRLPAIVPGAPSASGEPVWLDPLCNCTETGAAGQEYIAELFWETAAHEQVLHFLAYAEVALTVDGEAVADTAGYWGEPTEDAETGGYLVLWDYPLGQLAPGSHVIEVEVSLKRAVTDGLDADEDGELDVYGPGEVMAGQVEVVVGATAPATEEPAAEEPVADEPVVEEPSADTGMPAGQGQLVMLNCRGDVVTVDVLPAGVFQELAPKSGDACQRGAPISLAAGTYTLLASIAGVASRGEATIEIIAGQTLEFSWQ